MLKKLALRDTVYSHLVTRLVRQRYSPGTKLHDFQLAGELGYSRTPVREALLRLHSEGMVESDLHRGFRVPDLSAEEAANVYPIIAHLEALALRDIDLRAVDTALLKHLNAKMQRSQAAWERSENDLQFHATLLAPCGNRRLLALIRTEKQVVQKYELAYMRHAGRTKSSGSGHDDIIQSVEKRDKKAALKAIHEHWQGSMYRLRRMLRQKA
jgi:DNA-binding GntR family transcriptional regulator